MKAEAPSASELARSLCDQAAEHLIAGRLPEASSCLGNAVQLDPTGPLIHYRLGLLHSDSGRPDAALAAYDACLKYDGSFAKAHNNRGSILQVLGRHDEAFQAFQTALTLDPQLDAPYINLGNLLERNGEIAQACALYLRAIELGLDEGLFRHHIAAASQHSTSASPESWVRYTFDNFAPNFDAYLKQLGYAVPRQLAELLTTRILGKFDIVDLGCGTGLCGAALAAHRRTLVGVDLSARMLVEARRLGIYDELHADEIQRWLASVPSSTCDIVIAADVFIYIGALESVFDQVKRILRAGGWFAFSVEECAGNGHELRPTGRFAQAHEYIRSLARNKFSLAVERATTIRMEEGVPVRGRLYLLRRT